MMLPAVRVEGALGVKGLGSQNPKATALRTKAQQRAGRCLHVRYDEFLSGWMVSKILFEISALEGGSGLYLQ